MDYISFVSYDKSIFISVYVDNYLFISKDLKIINCLKNKLLEHFYMTDFGLVSHYFGMSITQI